jgi:hypothetical protein
MNRRALLLAALVAATDSLLPEPPVPPDDPPVDQAAPVPNPDARAPAAGPAGTQVRPEMFRKGTYDPSQGYANGSRFQDNEDRKVIQTPGLRLRVPIE